MAKQRTAAEEQQRIEEERAKIAEGGFWHKGAVWLLGRFPFTKHRYQNWTKGRRILIGWLLWLVCLPIIPAVAIAVWYFSDPEGFKRSPWAKGLIGLFVVWLGGFGYIATSQFVPDLGGIYSPQQTTQEEKQTKGKQDQKKTDQKTDKSKHVTKQPDGETKVVNNSPAAIASEESKRKVKDLKESKPTRGRTFENCTQAFESGVFNIRRSDPSYQDKLDRDGDGIACEK